MSRRAWMWGCLGMTLVACGSDAPTMTGGTAAPSASSSAPTPGEAPIVEVELPTREGSAIARDIDSRFVVIADEDHDTLRIVDLPLAATSQAKSLKMPGPPAQVLMLDKRVLVTIRQPSLVMAYDIGDTPTDPATWKQAFSTELPNDAWGLAVDPSTRTAFVSSAWGRQVSAVSIIDGKKRWSVAVAREPRGLLVRGDNLFVNHLVGSEITRISALAGAEPKVERRALWPAPLRTPIGTTPSAALGYALAASPDGRRLFVPRHAIGVVGEWNWYGATTVDVYNIARDEPVLGKPKYRRSVNLSEFPGTTMLAGGDLEYYWGSMARMSPPLVVKGGPVAQSPTMARQPRHVVYRARANTLLVASEGQNELVELDAVGPAPGLVALFSYPLGYEAKLVLDYPVRSGAPSGVVLSKNQSTAYVYCRSTDDLVEQPLEMKAFGLDSTDAHDSAKPTIVRLVDESAHTDPKDKTVELRQVGRATFFLADATKISQGAACATCHPDGRDDGFTWQEIAADKDEKGMRFMAHRWLPQALRNRRHIFQQKDDLDLSEPPAGKARQTPMLAGRVNHAGPFGWLAESEKLEDRVAAGMQLHRSVSDGGDYWDSTTPTRNYLGAALARYLREGLRPPARPDRPLTKLEEQGKALFMSPGVGCAGCHQPTTAYTDGTAYPNFVAPGKTYVEEGKETKFRTPPLAFVSGTEPYFHDGSRSSLESLIRFNNDKMGKTNQLREEEKKALVAFLETL